MATCEWAILCDYTFKDERGKMCVIGIFDRIFAVNVPTHQNQAAIVMKLTGDVGEKVEFKAEIIRPTGGTLGKITGNGTINDSGTLEINVNVQRMPLPDWGIYSFNIQVSEGPVKPLTFTVIKQSTKKARPH